MLTATLAILDTDGYGGLSFEAVARRAGTSRPAIYRRWSGRAPLVLAAIAQRLDIPEPPDTGCTLCDIGESFGVFLTAYRSIRPEVLSALYAECAPDPELRTRYLQTLVEPARTAVGCALDRAIAKGDLRSSIDRNLLLDLVGSLVHYRAMFGPEHLGDTEAEHAIEMLLQGAAVDYGALLAHSEALKQQHIGGSGNHHVHIAQ
ncbi:TetR/AcrR family transcriptional regulator [Lipingzhangella sp. LS1_29]|uniref:TetR/AcrR family transcriptional regulator n=1 Tax=Lipingzhangella rawalii TaxID=2055835 RepID=A0ABU2HBE6_9ACTN|nr:TetR/AcrR family transcriptional regulator [Lipingzhangella rawalii]MDS1272583.1 TetR/AcrR family transcriptional regulator [Lipingzhangella rawalii]